LLQPEEAGNWLAGENISAGRHIQRGRAGQQVCEEKISQAAGFDGYVSNGI
jgi:hypothetical protein